MIRNHLNNIFIHCLLSVFCNDRPFRKAWMKRRGMDPGFTCLPDHRGASRCRNCSRNACNAYTYTSRPLIVPVTYEAHRHVRASLPACIHTLARIHTCTRTPLYVSDLKMCSLSDVLGVLHYLLAAARTRRYLLLFTQRKSEQQCRI